MKRIFVLCVAAIAVVGAVFLARGYVGSADAGKIKFRTAKVDRGEVIEGVQASGTVQPILLVQVGTQVSGVLEKIFVDFNSQVKEGQTIALLDQRRMAAQIAQDEASVARAKADVERVQAQLTQAERDLARQKMLFEKKLIQDSDLDAAVAAFEVAKAQLAVSQAAVAQSQAQLEGDRINLAYATITSPISGIVVSRNVDVGQTVAASLSAPTLFTIANDLTKIQVQASVPEADIGKIQKEQKARFTVDAHPERTFDGVVSQVRLAPTTVQNVVTYTVLIDAANPRGLLLPGMTANVTFEVARSQADALRVPASALRVTLPGDTPAAKMGAPDAKGGPGDTKAGATEAKASAPDAAAGATEAKVDPKAHGGPAEVAWSRGDGQSRRGGGRRGGRGGVYVVQPDGTAKRIAVRTGISDGIVTTVEPLEPGTLDAGADVVTAVLRDEDESTTTNPFAPQQRMGGGQRGGGGGGGGRTRP